jgi:hypothetical protein
MQEEDDLLRDAGRLMDDGPDYEAELMNGGRIEGGNRMRAEAVGDGFDDDREVDSEEEDTFMLKLYTGKWKEDGKGGNDDDDDDDERKKVGDKENEEEGEDQEDGTKKKKGYKARVCDLSLFFLFPSSPYCLMFSEVLGRKG